MADVIQVVRGQQTQPAQDGADPAKADPQKPPPVEMDIAYMFEQVGIHLTRKAGTEDRRDTYLPALLRTLGVQTQRIDIYGPITSMPGRPKR